MSHGRDDDDPPKSPQVLLLIPLNPFVEGDTDQLFKRHHDSDSKVRLDLKEIAPQTLMGYTITHIIPDYNLDRNQKLMAFSGKYLRGFSDVIPTSAFSKVASTELPSDALMSKLELLSSMLNDSAVFELLARCSDGRIRYFFAHFHKDKMNAEVKLFEEPVVFFGKGYKRTRTEMHASLQARIKKQTEELDRSLNGEYGTMNFADYT